MCTLESREKAEFDTIYSIAPNAQNVKGIFVIFAQKFAQKNTALSSVESAVISVSFSPLIFCFTMLTE